jgi:TPR repeat protein
MYDAVASFNLWCNATFLFSKGIPQNEAKAFEFYSNAAQQGDPFGMFNMSNALKNGCGVDKDDGKALEFLQKASDCGHSKAQFNLAMRVIKNDRDVQELGLSQVHVAQFTIYRKCLS